MSSDAAKPSDITLTPLERLDLLAAIEEEIERLWVKLSNAPTDDVMLAHTRRAQRLDAIAHRLMAMGEGRAFPRSTVWEFLRDLPLAQRRWGRIRIDMNGKVEGVMGDPDTPPGGRP